MMIKATEWIAELGIGAELERMWNQLHELGVIGGTEFADIIQMVTVSVVRWEDRDLYLNSANPELASGYTARDIYRFNYVKQLLETREKMQAMNRHSVLYFLDAEIRGECFCTYLHSEGKYESNNISRVLIRACQFFLLVLNGDEERYLSLIEGRV